MLKPGDVFIDEFEVLSSLGSGGFATVYRARQRSTGVDVALKLLRLTDQTARRRFGLEARLLQQLSDPAVVQLLDHGVHEGQHYLVLEFIEGRTVRSTIEREGALGPRRTVNILEQVASAVAAAHALGALHRDLKPENVMITDDDDRVKVLDFGIAKLVGDHAVSTAVPMTQVGTTVGTPRYMSPEALCGTPPTPASDIYSLGMLTYEMLVGERALPNLEHNRLVERMVEGEPITIPDDADVPDELRELVAAMLEKSVAARIGTAAQVLERLTKLPEYPAKTLLMMPHELAFMREQEVADDAATIPEVIAAQTETTHTSPEVRLAAAQVRQDAEQRMRPAQLTTPTGSSEVETRAQPRRTHAAVGEPEEPPPELDRPPPRKRRLDLTWREVLGFAMFGIGLLLAAGYLAGVVRVQVSIVEGHPLECGFGRSSLHIERHFVVFGAELVELDKEIRCTGGPR